MKLPFALFALTLLASTSPRLAAQEAEPAPASEAPVETPEAKPVEAKEPKAKPKAKASESAAPPKDAGDDPVVAMEKALWQAFKDKDADAFRKFFADDYLGGYAKGFVDIKGEMEALRKSTISSVDLQDVKVSHPTKTSVLLAYKLTVRGGADGRDVSTSNASSLWVRRGDLWLTVLHMEVRSAR